MVALPSSPTASTSNEKASPGSKVEKNVQLRTPSPSIDSASAAHGKIQRSASPSTKIAHMSIEERQASPTRRGSISGSRTAIAPPVVFVPPEPTVESLTTHIAGIPPKTLHAYILSRIPRVPAESLPTLATFFDELAPPQKLHCVRCHKDFVEVENDDRSCLVPHDDESAEVERIGAAMRANRAPGTVGATYETLWGCCGKIVEGDGDQGPPDGWCYEGKHTTDIKRAKFRADSTPHDDKLVSCLRLNCHGIRAQLPRGARSMRKRPRSVNLKEASTDEDGSEGGSDSGMDEIVGKSASKARPKGKGKAKATSQGDHMDVDDTASVAGSVKGRGRPPKSKTQAPESVAKRRIRVTDSKVVPGTDGEDDDAQSVKSAPTASAQKRRGRVPKSKAVITDSDREMDVESMPALKGKEKEKATKARPRSPSRTRPGDASDASMGVGAKPKSRAKKARVANAKDVEAKADGADGDDEKPKKRRKVANA
ncbi:hypothetical protein OH76DRAFT_1398823 [Lentinus brumalis]|uniref:Uncharacterized protein n=1 Tax=Lentinus brumalis TaxID=2498619 RepID=A0A371DME8_9APHY|nr:hypothetical protein OH76DRAFT_1398823 [Polyporus brumalis]